MYHCTTIKGLCLCLKFCMSVETYQTIAHITQPASVLQCKNRKVTNEEKCKQCFLIVYLKPAG